MAPLIPIGVAFIGSLTLCLLCARAWLIEREEGLASSGRRLVAATVSTFAVGAIAVYASTISATPAEPPRRADNAKQGQTGASRRAQEQRLAELKKQQEATQRELEVLSLELGRRPQGPTRAELERRRAERQLAALELGFLVTVLGLVATAALGDPRTLLLRRKTRGGIDVATPLDAMARAAHAGAFEEALRAASTVEEETLQGIELIDFLYLRGIAHLQHGHQSGALLKPKAALFEGAVQDLSRVVALAPKMAEGHYALGVAYFVTAAYAEGAATLKRAGELAGNGKATELPIAKARSACLVRDGQRRLAAADADGAKLCFDEVMRLGILTKEIPAALMSHRLASVLRDLREGKLAEAREGLSLVRAARSDGLDAERQRIAELTCSVYEMLLWHKQGEHASIAAKLPGLLESWQPPHLPEPDEQAADEYLFAAVDTAQLDPPAPLFRALYFLVAVAELRVMSGWRASARPAALTEHEVRCVARPLFRALQFEPRQREVLAALGVLFYLCKPGSREKGLEWLDAAVAMGTSSQHARRLLDLSRHRARARESLLDEFRSASGRFLGDPMVEPKVRAALLEELGRFQEFLPVLSDLEHQSDIGQESPTLAALNERASYLRDVAAHAEMTLPAGAARSLMALRDELDELVNSVTRGTSRITELEQRVMAEIGRGVLR